MHVFSSKLLHTLDKYLKWSIYIKVSPFYIHPFLNIKTHNPVFQIHEFLKNQVTWNDKNYFMQYINLFILILINENEQMQL